MSNETAYKEGFDQGRKGSSRPDGFWEGWSDDDEAKEARIEGWKAGLLASALRGDSDDE